MSPAWSLLLKGLLLGALLEAVTLLFRFGFELQSTRDTVFLANYTFGLRIHHGYLGLVLLLVAVPRWIQIGASRGCELAIIVGIAMVFSDLVHHFLVLWPITGDPQFDLYYAN